MYDVTTARKSTKQLEEMEKKLNIYIYIYLFIYINIYIYKKINLDRADTANGQRGTARHRRSKITPFENTHPPSLEVNGC